MNDKKKATICWCAIIGAVLFLVIGVDYMPHLFCWIPLIVVIYFVSKCKPFLESFDRLGDIIVGR
jgi:hypothetical protein